MVHNQVFPHWAVKGNKNFPLTLCGKQSIGMYANTNVPRLSMCSNLHFYGFWRMPCPSCELTKGSYKLGWALHKSLLFNARCKLKIQICTWLCCK